MQNLASSHSPFALRSKANRQFQIVACSRQELLSTACSGTKSVNMAQPRTISEHAPITSTTWRRHWARQVHQLSTSSAKSCITRGKASSECGLKCEVAANCYSKKPETAAGCSDSTPLHPVFKVRVDLLLNKSSKKTKSKIFHIILLYFKFIPNYI